MARSCRFPLLFCLFLTASFSSTRDILRSGLYFAGASRNLAGNPVPKDLDNGVLTAMEAGAQAVLMSLWSVPDIETQKLMTSFYAKWLSGMEKHEALKQAQLEIRDKVRRSHEGRDLPCYWGAFILVGR